MYCALFGEQAQDKIIDMSASGHRMSRIVTEVKFAIFVCFHILPVELIPASSATSPRRAVIKAHAKGFCIAASRNRRSMHVESVGGYYYCCTPVNASRPC